MRTNELSDLFLEARALLAVGMDGNIVVLAVSPENPYLVSAAREGTVNIRPLPVPTEPGLYEFRGYSTMEYDTGFKPHVIHRGQCHKVAC